MEFQEVLCVGSGVLFYDFERDKYFLLTCGHNFVDIKEGMGYKKSNVVRASYFH